ncbi:MAG: hypothetical protein ACI4ES_12865 [Roseburia sp.]
MKVDELVDAIGKIDAKYVEEAEQPYVRRKSDIRRKSYLKKGLSFAACLGIFIVGGIWLQQSTVKNQMSSTTDMAEAPQVNQYQESAAMPQEEEGIVESAPEDSDVATVEKGGISDFFYKNERTDVWVENDGETAQVPQGEAAGDETTNENRTVEDLEKNYGIVLLSELVSEGFDQTGIKANSDSCILNFKQKHGEGSLMITAGRVVTSRFGNLMEQNDLQVSEWNGYQVIFLQLDQEEHYLAQYQSGTAYVEVEAENLTEDEFLEVLKSLLM